MFHGYVESINNFTMKQQAQAMQQLLNVTVHLYIYIKPTQI